jgi:chorismate synthase
LAKLVLQQLGVKIIAYVSQVGTLKLATPVEQLDLSVAETNAVRCPDTKLAEEMFTYIDEIRKQGDSVGGVVSAYITGCPVGLGEPVFDKLHAELGKAMLSINAVKGFEYGSGFDGVELRGSQHNDIIVKDEAGKVSTVTNHSGGIQGGISNGEPIYFRVGFKPVATIMQDQDSLNESGEKIVVSGKGRHDPCVVPRAVPIVEAMAAIVLLDFYLRNRLTKLSDVL